MQKCYFRLSFRSIFVLLCIFRLFFASKNVMKIKIKFKFKFNQRQTRRKSSARAKHCKMKTKWNIQHFEVTFSICPLKRSYSFFIHSFRFLFFHFSFSKINSPRPRDDDFPLNDVRKRVPFNINHRQSDIVCSVQSRHERKLKYLVCNEWLME